ncbi:sensor histidine kinase [Janthinobacterium sp. GW460P]|uniref:sensor histidine kinase n=1 Tax=unclassified Janthinobacterium TaxID=2610881 RepID=UPI001482647C|nr:MULTISPECIES: sensor histidine kinase [unclassified Janthinobacterium]MCC7706059.1 sensor histidine kinase [Janthinobacterium sp. GW460P]MCC7711566.1 sensor histidine kinase [Janthinobacterium sp. GW460W]
MPFLLAIFLFFLHPLATYAAPPALAPLVLPDSGQPVSASGHMLLLRDPGGTLAADAALASPGWRVLPGAVSAGYTDDTVWLLLAVRRGARAPDEWVLRFSNAVLDHASLYRFDAKGQWRVQEAGAAIARGDWPVDARQVVFPLRLEEGETERWLVRLNSKKAMSTELGFWPRAAFDESSRREYLYYGLQFGTYLLLILFHIFFWRMTGESQSGWYLLYVCTSATTEAFTIAIPQQIFAMPNWLSDPVLGVSLCMSLAVGTRFSSLQLDLPELFPRLTRWLAAISCAMAAAGACLVLSGKYGPGVLAVQYTALPLIVIFIATAAWLACCGRRSARAFLLIFGIFYAGAIISFLRNMAILPPNFLTNHAATLGAFVHMMLMSLRLNRRYAGLRRAKDLAQAQAVQAVRALNERLEEQVALRTAALQQEIGRRAALEGELRAALEVETRTREEQQDFVAMVSHEFHTPLAIINTTAQQIARNPGAAWEKTAQRCQNLREASGRMSALVDEYLSADRMDTSSATFRPQWYDPRMLVESVLAEWPAGRVTASLPDLPARLQCDPGLLRVALRNLLSNADRHAPQAQAIRFDASVPADGGIQFTVSNDGEALPADEIPRLFQKYFRGRIAQHKPGAGLGLYLVQRIAELHGGRVALEHTGSDGIISFSLRLPA